MGTAFVADSPTDSWTFLDAVRRQAERYGDRVFCTFGDGETLTFAEFETETDAVASGLADIGVEAGDRVMALRSEEHTPELQSRRNLLCRLLLEKKKNSRIRCYIE